MSKMCDNVFRYDRERYKKIYQFPDLETWTSRFMTKTDVAITGSVFYVDRSGSYKSPNFSEIVDVADYSLASNGAAVVFKIPNFISLGESIKTHISYNIRGALDMYGAGTLPDNVFFTLYDNMSDLSATPVTYGNKIYECNINYSDYGDPGTDESKYYHHYLDAISYFYQDATNENNLYLKISNDDGAVGMDLYLPYITMSIIGVGSVNWCYVNQGEIGTYQIC